MTELAEPFSGTIAAAQLSLSTVAARNLATTTKSVPQMQGITSRWLLKLLPWVQADGGVYRVNRRLTYTVGDGLITCYDTAGQARVLAPDLRELRYLRQYSDDAALQVLADSFVERQYAPGDIIAEAGQPAEELVVLAHGKADKLGTGAYDESTVLEIMTDGRFIGERILGADAQPWDFTVKAVTACTCLVLTSRALAEVSARIEGLREHVRVAQLDDAVADERANPYGESSIELASGHDGEPQLQGTFVDYDLSPREYELSIAQTVLRVHSRVADLYNKPMDQIEQQLRLTIEALRERQEDEMVNNRDFGLLHNAAPRQRISTRTGPPTPDDLDELLALVWKEPAFFLANPKAIAAFGAECSRRGIYPTSTELNGHRVPSWRGIPILPCNKIGTSASRTTSIMLMRTGEAAQGVIGLRQTGIPDEYEPGLNVRFMGIDDKAIISYLVSTYYSGAVLVPDALAILENVQLGAEV
ncbi:family 2B encapsulin nanocompartment shell protein [Nocardia salmonicida]|uniref:family 2B encapsulin nanocompartment shell protein n=1 Tax=Nocardia TaxID=1817 RepID=UPI0026588104|nr:family 2B encapsulin nanocompartment shell protein [Nocardia sp. PE-7]WKG11879.1 family 2B encapsulin nanocompartment shell protein [Nocardia sp. PE-7]